MVERRKARAPDVDGRSRRRWASIVTVAAAGALVIALACTLPPPAPLLLWNASPSSPVGLYAVGAPAGLRSGDMAIAWAPPRARRLAARRHYLPANVPLVKTVAATSGARVCGIGERITINGHPVAGRRSRDPSGRPMPWWSGCARLRSGEVFLLSPGVGEAFDGRYFGVTRPGELIGSATLLWPR